MFSKLVCLLIGHRWRTVNGFQGPCAEACDRCGLWEPRPSWFFSTQGRIRDLCRRDLRGE